MDKNLKACRNKNIFGALLNLRPTGAENASHPHNRPATVVHLSVKWQQWSPRGGPYKSVRHICMIAESKCVVSENNNTHPMEGSWKFREGGGLNSQNL